MKRDSQIFQSFWFGDTITPYEKVCMRSFIDHGHSFHLYAYSSRLEVPADVRLMDASELFDQSECFTYRKGRGAGSHSAFSNVFRYKLLAERGGWWVDTDVVCLSGEIPYYSEFFAHESDEIVNGAVLFFQPADPLMRDCLMEASRIGDQAAWGEIGPRLITRKLKETGRISGAQPKESCYPIHHKQALDLLRPTAAQSLTERTHSSLFLHLWNEVFRRVSVAKTMLPPRGSLLRGIVERHPVEGWTGEYDGEFLEQTLNVQSELRRLREENEALRTRLHRIGPKTTNAARALTLSARLRILKTRLRDALKGGE